MKTCTEIQDLLIDFLEKNLDTDTHAEVQKHLEKCEACQTELAELQDFTNLIPQMPIITVPQNVKNTFYQTLEQEKASLIGKPLILRTVRWYETVWTKAAAAVLILALGFVLGHFSQKNAAGENQPEIADLQKEVKEMKQLVMLQMFKKESASERLQAVSHTYEVEKPDKQLLTALIETLHYDRNVNVRLAAANALSRFGNEPEVREALMMALRKQTEPNIQIALIELLVSLKETKALPELQQIMQGKNQPEIVRFKAAEGVKVLL